MKRKQMLGNALLTLTALIWGTAFVGQRRGMDVIGPLTFTSARMALAATAVGVFAIVKRAVAEKQCDSEHDRARNGYTLRGGLCCGLFLALGSILQQMGIVYTTAGKAGFITSMYMLLVPVFSALLFKRKNSAAVRIAVGIGLLGMYLLCVDGPFRLTRGDGLIALCAVFFSFHILCCDHFAPLGRPVEIAALQFATVAVISAAIGLPLEHPAFSDIQGAAIPILYCGLISGGLGYTLQIVSQRYTEPATASLLMSLESVFAAIAGAVLLHEQLTRREIAGCIIMFAAILLIQFPAHKDKYAGDLT